MVQFDLSRQESVHASLLHVSSKHVILEKWVGGTTKSLFTVWKNISAVIGKAEHVTSRVPRDFKRCWLAIVFPWTKPATLSCTDWHPMRCHYCKRLNYRAGATCYVYPLCSLEGWVGISMNVAFQTDEIPAKLLYCPSVIFENPFFSVFLCCSLVKHFPLTVIHPSLLFASSRFILVKCWGGVVTGGGWRYTMWSVNILK